MNVTLGGVRGQARAIDHLSRMLRGGRLPHALLFAGPPGVGKLTTARAVAMALSCLDDPGIGCGACAACHKIATGVHPDVLLLRPQGAGRVIAIGEARGLAARLGYAPHEGRARVIILEDADRLTPEASNAFLKTLEEPPARTHFILTTAAPDRLLVTIHSRCQRVLFAPLGMDDIARVLSAGGIAPGPARAAAALAGGSAARALELAEGDEMEKRRARVRAFTEAARAGRVKAAVDAASELAGDKDEIGPTLELLGLWYRDAAALAAGAPASVLYHSGEDLDALRTESEGAAAADLARCAGAVLETQKALLGYANAQLALERLVLALHRP